jgi:hypothetical protein
MNNILYVLLYVLVGVGVALMLFRIGVAAQAYFKLRGKMLVTCPETKIPAAVDVDAKGAAERSILTEPHLRLSECSRWPERQGCGQECLSQIEAAPEECLVRTFVARWYARKACAYCGKPIEGIDWLGGQQPALLDPDRKTVQWNQISPENLPEVLAKCAAVCWNCHITESFRRDHPELVVERPWRKAS